MFDLKYTNHNKYVVESPEILIRKLSLIRIEREKYVKASKHAKSMVFDQKVHFVPKLQNAQHLCTCIHHSELDSEGKFYPQTVETFLHTPKQRGGKILQYQNGLVFSARRIE